MAITIPGLSASAGLHTGTLTARVGERIEIPVKIDGAELALGETYEVTPESGDIDFDEESITISQAQVDAGSATLTFVSPDGFRNPGAGEITILHEHEMTPVARIEFTILPATPTGDGGNEPDDNTDPTDLGDANGGESPFDIDAEFEGPGRLRMRWPSNPTPAHPQADAPPPATQADTSTWSPGGCLSTAGVISVIVLLPLCAGLTPAAFIAGILWFFTYLSPVPSGSVQVPQITVEANQVTVTGPTASKPPSGGPAVIVTTCPGSSPSKDTELLEVIRDCIGKDACEADRDCRELCLADDDCRTWLE